MESGPEEGLQRVAGPRLVPLRLRLDAAVELAIEEAIEEAIKVAIKVAIKGGRSRSPV
jgi:hypothetical protein